MPSPVTTALFALAFLLAVIFSGFVAPLVLGILACVNELLLWYSMIEEDDERGTTL